MMHIGTNHCRPQSRAFTSLRTFQVGCFQVTCCDSNTFPSLMKKMRFKDLICPLERSSCKALPKCSLSHFHAPLHIPTLVFCMEGLEGSPHPPTHPVLCPGKCDWKPGKCSGSPLTEITGVILAEGEGEESTAPDFLVHKHGLWSQLTVPTMPV